MQEEWRPIGEFKGRYEVSNYGRVRSLDRYAKVGGGGYRLAKGKQMKIGRYPNGYSMVNLNMGDIRVSRLVHRLVAQAFIPNPDNLPEVNHKDENINNNRVDNLEWCTSKYNANYGSRNAKCREKNRRFFKSVYQIDKDCGMVIRWWECTSDAAKKLGVDETLIGKVCKGKGKTAGGFIWRYTDEYDREQAV